MSVYTTESLARAAAPVRTVIDSFFSEVPDEPSPIGICSQERFVSLLLSMAQPRKQDDDDEIAHIIPKDNVDWSSVDLLPSDRYVQRLVQRYTSRLEESDIELGNDDLAALVCHFSMSRCGRALPDPTSPCIVTFRVPPSNDDDNPVCDDDAEKTFGTSEYAPLRIRTYPHHNDVGAAKVWEAGACLAEFLIRDPRVVRDRNVVELGAGVGLTGLVAAGVAGARSVHMTDYTAACLDNLAHNASLENGRWLAGRRVRSGTVTVGRLEWGEYSNVGNGDAVDANVDLGHPWADSVEALSRADVLLAGDVVYLVEVIPDLVATVCKFLGQDVYLSEGRDCERTAIFATTYRNKDTFALFENELEEKNIFCEYHSVECLPNIFPCYFNQPRSDVRVCTMRIKHQ